MFQLLGPSPIHFCQINELVPGFVRKQSKRAQFATLFEMTKNLRGNALQLFRVCGFWKLRAILHKSFLRTRRFLMSFANESNQLLPRLAMCAAVLSRVDRRKFPLVIA